MSTQGRLARLWHQLNSESTPDVYNIIKKKYYNIFQLTALYSNFEGYWVYISLIQYTFFLFLLASLCVILILSIPKMANVNFVLFSQVIHHSVVTSLALAIMIFFVSNRSKLARFHKIIPIGVYDYREDDGQTFKSFDDEILKEWNNLLFIPLILGVAGLITLVIGPILDKYGTFRSDEVKDKTLALKTPVPMYYPFNVDDNRYIVYAATFFQLVGGTYVALIMASGGLLYVCLTQTVAREFRILLNAVETIEDRVNIHHNRIYGSKASTEGRGAYESPTFQRCYNLCLKKIYEHHLATLSFADDVTALIGVPNIISFCGGPLMIALASLAATTSGSQLPGTALTSLVLCLIETIYMYLFSFMGQRVTDLSENFREKLYALKWYQCTKEQNQNFRIFQTVTLKPYVLYGPYKSLPSTLKTFSSVMNSSYSFYNLMMAAK